MVVPPHSKADWKGGEVVFAGGTDWAWLGRSPSKQSKKSDKEVWEELARQEKYPNLYEPHRLRSMLDIKIAFVAAGTAACHCILADTNGVCYAMGRNDKGQLGLGDVRQRNQPTKVTALAGKAIVAAAAGRHHSIFVTTDGDAYAAGSNSMGQCGIGAVKSRGNVEETLHTPVKSMVEDCSAAACGIDFTMWLADGKLYAAGNPQYGQLGDGSDHMYNSKDSSLKLVYDPQPVPKKVTALSGKNILRMACGQNHTIAIDDEGGAYTWGFGGYGRLGHKDSARDEMLPRQIDTFKGRMAIPKDAVLAAGSTASFCTSIAGQMFSWGKSKVSGDNTTYPQPLYDLQGWNVRSMACGPLTYAIAADNSVIIWGAATNGELGFGIDGKRSSANPAKCEFLDDVYTHQVACGVGFTLFLVDPQSDKIKKLPVYDAPEADEPIVNPSDIKGKGKGGKAQTASKTNGSASKRKGGAVAPQKKQKKTKAG